MSSGTEARMDLSAQPAQLDTPWTLPSDSNCAFEIGCESMQGRSLEIPAPTANRVVPAADVGATFVCSNGSVNSQQRRRFYKKPRQRENCEHSALRRGIWCIYRWTAAAGQQFSRRHTRFGWIRIQHHVWRQWLSHMERQFAGFNVLRPVRKILAIR